MKDCGEDGVKKGAKKDEVIAMVPFASCSAISTFSTRAQM
jgi:hypothetical protein